MRKGYFEIKELYRPFRHEIGECMEYSLSFMEGMQFLDEIEEFLSEDSHTLAAGLVADKRLLNYTRKVIQLTEEKIAFESKKSVDNEGR
jgi:hypothetical protein